LRPISLETRLISASLRPISLARLTSASLRRLISLRSPATKFLTSPFTSFIRHSFPVTLPKKIKLSAVPAATEDALANFSELRDLRTCMQCLKLGAGSTIPRSNGNQLLSERTGEVLHMDYISFVLSVKFRPCLALKPAIKAFSMFSKSPNGSGSELLRLRIRSKYLRILANSLRAFCLCQPRAWSKHCELQNPCRRQIEPRECPPPVPGAACGGSRNQCCRFAQSGLAALISGQFSHGAPSSHSGGLYQAQKLRYPKSTIRFPTRILGIALHSSSVESSSSNVFFSVSPPSRVVRWTVLAL
jgi:hypothetical protein